MTARPAFGATVSLPHSLDFDDIYALGGYLRGLSKGRNQQRVRVIISRETKGRTLPQNSWLWGAIYPAIADWSGHTVDEIHGAMKEMHGLKSLIHMPGVGQTLIPRSTSEYTTDEFSEYVERCRAWAAMQGLNIPDPGRYA